MRRFLACLLAALLLTSASPMRLLANPDAGRSGGPLLQPTEGLPSPLHGLETGIPDSLRAQARAAWQGLSREEQERYLKQFLADVGPRVREALARHRPDSAALPPAVGRPGAGVMRTAGARVLGNEALRTSSGGRAPICPLQGLIDCGSQSPTVTANASPTSGAAPLTVQFFGDAWDPDGWIEGTLWDFGDGNAAYGSYQSHTYTNAGTYWASFSAWDNDGNSSAGFVVITVSGGGGGNSPPSVSASASPSSGMAPLAVSFAASASDPDGSIVSYQWSFGDGSSASGSSVSHTYAGPGTFSAQVTVADNFGATATATATVNVLANGSDADADGILDGLEDQLAAAYMPLYHISAGEQPGTGFARYADQPTLAITQNLPPLPPVIHYRVSPIGTGLVSGVPYAFHQIDYLALWNRDDGLQIGGICLNNMEFLSNLTGWPLTDIADLSGAFGHIFEQERSAILVGAPASSAQDLGAYRAYDYYLAAHEGTFFDHSTYIAPASPVPPGLAANLWMSRGKHGTYADDPNFLPLFPGWLIASTNFAIWDLYWFGWIQWWELLIYLGIADNVFFACVVEHFSEQGGIFPGLTLQVGEVPVPINGSSFILDPRVRGKLEPKLWLIQ